MATLEEEFERIKGDGTVGVQISIVENDDIDGRMDVLVDEVLLLGWLTEGDLGLTFNHDVEIADAWAWQDKFFPFDDLESPEKLMDFAEKFVEHVASSKDELVAGGAHG